MWMRKCLSLVLMTSAFGAAAVAAPYAEYRVTIVGPANSSAADINQAGVVVGSYPSSTGALRGFLNRGKGLVDLGALGRSSEAVAINDRGEVLGNWTTTGGQQRGFIYYAGKQRDIGVIPDRSTVYTDINNHGYVTATGFSASLNGSRGFLRDPKGRFTDIGKLPFDEPTLTSARALNNRNQITGDSGPLTFPDQPLRAYIWSKGVIRDLGDLGADPNAGLDINDRGQITGFMALPTGFRDQVAFLYSNGRIINIDGRPETEDRFSSGTGINNHGHIVGTSDHLGGFVYRGKRMQSLNALIDPRLGWDIRLPQAINDAGQIAATAFRKGVQYAVRLDLIRPHGLGEPYIEDEAGAAATAKTEGGPSEAARSVGAARQEATRQ